MTTESPHLSSAFSFCFYSPIKTKYTQASPSISGNKTNHFPSALAACPSPPSPHLSPCHPISAPPAFHSLPTRLCFLSPNSLLTSLKLCFWSCFLSPPSQRFPHSQNICVSSLPHLPRPNGPADLANRGYRCPLVPSFPSSVPVSLREGSPCPSVRPHLPSTCPPPHSSELTCGTLPLSNNFPW